MTWQERQQHDALCELSDAMGDDNGWEDDILRGKTTAEDQPCCCASSKTPLSDPLTCRNWTQITVDAFAVQLQAMTTAYMGWSSAMSEKGLSGEYEQPEDLVMQDKEQVWMVNLFSAYTKDVLIVKGNKFLTSAYFRQGLMPSTPYDPNVLIILQCPRLRIQAFVRGLCDLYGVPPHANLGAQFSITFDIYLSIRAAVEGYGHTVPGESKEWDNNCVVPGDYYLLRIEVDAWAKDSVDEVMRSFEPSSEEDEGTGCSEGWQNMKEDVTACAWGMYDETGIFPALCRHGFVLVAVDMVKGELAKYGLSVINHLIRALSKIGMGHNIGCKTTVIVKMHPQLSQLASNNKFRLLVGSFHSHGHNCLCQVSNLATYVEGMGSEDSRTSPSLPFLPRPRLWWTYHCGATVFITNKYRCAPKIKQGLPALHTAMKSLGVTVCEEFAAWLRKEKQYLQILTKEPIQETMEMEYYQKLMNYRDNETDLAIKETAWAASRMFAGCSSSLWQGMQLTLTHRVEMQRRHAEELAHKSLGAVQDLEMPGSEEWERAAKMVSSRHYQRMLDQLQGLVVVRMFELTKVNTSGTGYKLRKHIAKALQVRSKAVKSALDCYNVAAAAMTLPKPQLVWAQVVECAFLAEFDLLHEGREDIHAEPCTSASMHMEHLVRLSKQLGFTADIVSRGVSVSKEREVPATPSADASARNVPMPDTPPPPLHCGGNANPAIIAPSRFDGADGCVMAHAGLIPVSTWSRRTPIIERARLAPRAVNPSGPLNLATQELVVCMSSASSPLMSTLEAQAAADAARLHCPRLSRRKRMKRRRRITYRTKKFEARRKIAPQKTSPPDQTHSANLHLSPPRHTSRTLLASRKSDVKNMWAHGSGIREKDGAILTGTSRLSGSEVCSLARRDEDEDGVRKGGREQFGMVEGATESEDGTCNAALLSPLGAGSNLLHVRRPVPDLPRPPTTLLISLLYITDRSPHISVLSAIAECVPTASSFALVVPARDSTPQQTRHGPHRLSASDHDIRPPDTHPTRAPPATEYRRRGDGTEIEVGVVSTKGRYTTSCAAYAGCDGRGRQLNKTANNASKSCRLSTRLGDGLSANRERVGGGMCLGDGAGCERRDSCGIACNAKVGCRCAKTMRNMRARRDRH
ncbi:hypothetical protein K438DRAFT_1752611 [Mycena galopus ATCC 62051]|nr:hypothetical protein K438DRAFT_1752611 [Mycena galopus ATCC 62051]